MDTNKLQLNHWNQQLSPVIDQLGTAHFFPSLIGMLAGYLPFDHPQVWLFRRDLAPTVIYHEIKDRQEANIQIDSYIEGGYLQDPFYLSAISHKKSPGCYRITEISKQTLKQSDYYRSYYAQLDTSDEIAYITELDDDAVLHISLMRDMRTANFEQAELDFLRDIEPTIRSLSQAHARLIQLSDIDGEKIDATGVNKSVHRAFDLFGRSLLTGREKDVLALMLQGHSTKISAEKLGISPETLRRHRKNMYQKLDVSSQTELFSLFLNSLSHFEQSPIEDPLSSYFAKPKK
jgi:DNA-binding CsgD family transcriptional regulator